MKLNPFALFMVAALLAHPVAAQTSSDMQILADKIKADKKLVVASNMELTEDEAKAFWPVYDAYQKDLQALNQRVRATLKSYADAHNAGSITDETAKKLVNDALALEEDEVKLKRSYVPKLEKVLPGIKVARYIQLENKIRAVVKYELASLIPLVK
jgi:hypothetical protein